VDEGDVEELAFEFDSMGVDGASDDVVEVTVDVFDDGLGVELALPTCIDASPAVLNGMVEAGVPPRKVVEISHRIWPFAQVYVAYPVTVEEGETTVGVPLNP
jgi:hypothetical protein